METAKESGNEVAISIILEKAKNGSIKSEDVGPMIQNVRNALEQVSSRDHIYKALELVEDISPETQ